MGLRVVVSAPCIYKGEYKGQVLGWIALPRIYNYFISGIGQTSLYSDALIYQREYLHLPEAVHRTIQLGGTVTTIGQRQLTGTLVQSLGKTVVTNTGPPGQISVSHAGNLSPAVRLSPPPGSDIDDSGALDTLQDLVLGNDTPMLPHNMLGLGGNMFSGLLTSLPATGTFARSVHALLTYVNQVLASNGMQGVRL